MVTKMFGREFGIRDRASQYFENIVLFDMATNPKYIIYYEDLMIKGKDEFKRLSDWLGHDCEVLPWAKGIKESLEKYDSPALSGGVIDFHKKRIEDLPMMHAVIQGTNRPMYDKYLTSYENI